MTSDECTDGIPDLAQFDFGYVFRFAHPAPLAEGFAAWRFEGAANAEGRGEADRRSRAIERRPGLGAPIEHAQRERKRAGPTHRVAVNRAARARSIHRAQASVAKDRLSVEPTLRLSSVVQFRLTTAKTMVGTSRVLDLPKLRNYSPPVPSIAAAPDCREGRTMPPPMLSSTARNGCDVRA